MTVAYPADSRPRLTNAAIRGSSSTIRIVVIRRPLAAARRRPRGPARAARAVGSGRWIVNVAPPPGVSVTTHCPPWPFVIASTIARPSPEPPDRALAVGAVEAAEDAMAGGGRDAGAVVAHPQLGARGVEAAAELDRRAGGRVLGGVVGELQPGLQQAVVIAAGCRPRAIESDAPGVAGDDGDELADAGGERRRGRPPSIVNPSPSTVASRSMSSTSRVIRSSSAMPISRVLATSAASLGSISSRWPRTIVIGVLSSWRTSSSSCRCTSTEPSSRSSIELTVRVRSEMSSLPCGGQARRHVVEGDRVRGVAQVADRREQAAGDEPADDADGGQHGDRGDRVGRDRGRHGLSSAPRSIART